MRDDTQKTATTLHVVGGGLAGCEAALAAANLGVPVVLHEMRGTQKTFAHQTDTLAELVCSNSLRSDDASANAVGVLHAELRRSGSAVMAAADQNQVPAGSALAVDREGFADHVQHQVLAHPLVTVERVEINGWPPAEWAHCIIATGPLTSSPLAAAIQANTGQESLAFFDAIAPIIYAESINMDVAWFQSRYDKPGPGGTGKDYINCPMTQAQYEGFVDALLAGEKTQFKEWEKDTPYFDACLPIEVMAERGRETLRFGPMKPVGLTNPRDGSTPHAVVQLRQDNALGTLFNIVGFQTKLKYLAQKDIFKLIPGLEDAEFARLGGIHRNSFIKSPILLDAQLRLKSEPRIRFAGQITGVEGYVESAATGLLAGRMAACEILGVDMPLPPQNSGFGALLHHVTGGANADSFQPMNVNFGLMPPPPALTNAKGRKRAVKGAERKKVLARIARASHWDYEQSWRALLGLAALPQPVETKPVNQIIFPKRRLTRVMDPMLIDIALQDKTTAHLSLADGDWAQVCADAALDDGWIEGPEALGVFAGLCADWAKKAPLNDQIRQLAELSENSAAFGTPIIFGA